MPHDPVTLREDILAKEVFGGHDSVVRTEYIAPADGDGGIADDPFKDYDVWVADRMHALLREAYPGHFWKTVHDTVFNPKTNRYDKIALISIPLLMGGNNYVAINLVKNPELTPGRVLVAGGEILERYGLLRGRFELDPFLEAREKHSALVVPSRKVPG